MILPEDDIEVFFITALVFLFMGYLVGYVIGSWQALKWKKGDGKEAE